MNNHIPTSYFHDCKNELEYTLSKLNEGNEKEYYLAQLFYKDEIKSVDIPINFIIPIPSSYLTFYRDTLGKIVSVYPIKISQADLISFIVEYLSWINSILANEIYDSVLLDKLNAKKTLIKITRGVLKKKCQELAIKYDLVKGEELTFDKIHLIVTDLIRQGYIANEKSVGTTLREKLGYRKYKDY